MAGTDPQNLSELLFELIESISGKDQGSWLCTWGPHDDLVHGDVSGCLFAERLYRGAVFWGVRHTDTGSTVSSGSPESLSETTWRKALRPTIMLPEKDLSTTLPQKQNRSQLKTLRVWMAAVGLHNAWCTIQSLCGSSLVTRTAHCNICTPYCTTWYHLWSPANPHWLSTKLY